MKKKLCLIAASGLFIVSLMFLGAGCTSSLGSYNSAQVYDQSLYGKTAKEQMSYEGIYRNPVIVVHGFLGSKLENPKTGEMVWGYFKGIESIESFPAEYMRELAVPMAYGKPLKDLKSSVVPAGILDTATVRLLGANFHLHGYDKLISLLNKGGYVTDGKPLPEGKNFSSLFLFSYDWRRDLPENSARLHEFIMKKKAYIQKEYERLYGIKNFDVQFDIIAHSMGGLLSRYYLRYGERDLPEDGSMPKLTWRGSKHIDKLVIAGTPNAGYLDTCVEMVNGLQLVNGGPVYPPAVIGTFATYYQMMPLAEKSIVYADDPNGPGLNLFDPQVWIDMKWGLANPQNDADLQKLLPDVKTKEQRRKIALDHLTKCLKRAKQFTDAMRVEAEPPDDVSLFLFVGDAVPTRNKLTADRKTGKLKTVEYDPGDGKVLASSARFDKWEDTSHGPFVFPLVYWHGVIHLKAAHMGILSSDDFANNAAYLLLAFPSKKQRQKYGK